MIVFTQDDMLFLYRLGCADWDHWAALMLFQWIIREHGTPEEKQRIRALKVGYVG